MVDSFSFSQIGWILLSFSPFLQEIHSMFVIFTFMIPFISHEQAICAFFMQWAIKPFVWLFFHFGQESFELDFFLNSIQTFFLDFLDVLSGGEFVWKAEVESLLLDHFETFVLRGFIKLNLDEINKLEILANTLKKLIQILPQHFGLNYINFPCVSSFDLEGFFRIEPFPVKKSLNPDSTHIICINEVPSDFWMVKLK